MLGPFERPFFAAGDARTDVQQALVLDVLRAPFGIGKVGIAAVDDHVAGGQQRNQLVDELVDRRPGLDQHHHFARPSQIADQLLDAVAADKTLACGAALDQGIHLVDRAVKHGHAEAAAFHVQGQVLAHHGQTDQAKIAKLAHGIAPILLKCGGRPPRWFEEFMLDNFALVPQDPPSAKLQV